ncbi:inner centromere protein b, partial [Lasius niger]
MPEQITKSLLNDKPNIKQTEVQKVTPLSKTKMMQSSISYPKALTASGANIVTSVDSFIQPPKSINKANSVKLEDKRRHEEDARKKREEGLRLRTEEER